MLIAVLSGFLLALFTPWLCRLSGRHSGWLLSLLPASLFFYFLGFLPDVQHDALVMRYPWVPALDIQLSFLVDGLSLLFALLISGIGFFIIIYTGNYLAGHRHLGRLQMLLLAFMASMLGLVLSDNLISLFVFWELTSITSCLLIAFNHEDARARRSALQGLYVTVAGGLALMTGFILLAMAGGSYELSELLTQGEALREHGSYLTILLLILAGAFTKSAQFPLHFWLPNAMAAPTPVSAYLHSATMVKAGVYLLARLHPALGGTDPWFVILSLTGAVTMFAGVFLALRNTGIKRVLAYSTVMALGTLTMLIGIGTALAITAAMAYLLAHSLYKGALFLIAGIIDHETGARDFLDTGGLRRALPLTAACAVLAALSLGGVLPLFGFIAKELVLDATLKAPLLSVVLTTFTVAVAAMGIAVAAMVGIRPWFGQRQTADRPIHEAPPALLAGPVVLASLGLLFGMAAPLVESGLLGAAISASYGAPVSKGLSLWHGVNLPLLLSIASLLAGGLLYSMLTRFRQYTAFADRLAARIGPEALYDRFMGALLAVAGWQTRILQNGYLRYYLIIMLLTTVGLIGAVLFLHQDTLAMRPDFSGIRLHELAIVATLLLATGLAITSSSRLAAVASLGAVGFTVALLYVLFSAPDLGITQVLVETLTVILLVLVLFRLPGFLKLSSTALRLRDGAIAIAVGVTMTTLMLAANSISLQESIATYFVEQSQPLGHGRNIVNVILVDFRALDTLGELFVLALAATGVLAMIRFRAEDRNR